MRRFPTFAIVVVFLLGAVTIIIRRRAPSSLHLPADHQIVQRLEADLDADGTSELIIVSGEPEPIMRPSSITPAQFTVFAWKSWRWVPSVSFTDARGTIPGEPHGSEYHPNRAISVETITGDGRPEIVFKTIDPRPLMMPCYVRVLNYQDGRCTPLFLEQYVLPGGFVFRDVDKSTPGREIVCWSPFWMYGTEEAPPRYTVKVAGWNGHRFESIRQYVLTVPKAASIGALTSDQQDDAYFVQLDRALNASLSRSTDQD